MRVCYLFFFLAAVSFMACWSCAVKSETTASPDTLAVLKPVVVTEKVAHDSDDPAIWINRSEPGQSLVIGTDKGEGGVGGGVYAFDLSGKRVDSVVNLKRPNNIDVAYGLTIGGVPVDIAVCTERNSNSIRVFSLPSLDLIDDGGIPVFEGDSLRDPMGIALYTDPSTKNIYAIVGRKTGPKAGYLQQYLLVDNGKGNVKGNLVRTFGNFSQQKEIESIAVDNELGFVYCSDEGVGIRKYYAHPDSSAAELALFGTSGFAGDHEGISIYKTSATTGFLLISDQQRNSFQIFTRERSADGSHSLLKQVRVSAEESDGSEITHIALPGFEKGLFVAMSTDGTFHYYRADEILGELVKNYSISANN